MEPGFWIKGIGLICIFLACVAAGMELENLLKRKWQFFQELQELFGFLEKEMLFHHTAVPDALTLSAQSSGTWLKDILFAVVEGIKQGKGQPFEQIWTDAVDKAVPSGVLGERERSFLYKASAALSGNDTVMQRTLMQQNQERFRELCSAAQKEHQEKGRLIRSLMTAAGAFLVIVLI